MRILVDVDGCLADLITELCVQVNSSMPPSLNIVTPEHFTTPEFKDSGFGDDLLHIMEEMMVRSGFVQDLPEYLGARRLITDLISLGHNPVFLTKPYRNSPTWAYDRQVWLEKTFGPGIPVVQTAHKELVRGDVLIEDNHNNLSSWLSHHPNGTGILIRRPWNADAQFHPRMHIVDTLEEIQTLLGA